MAVISLVIAAMHVSSFIDQNMLESAESELPNYEMKFYLGSRKAAILATALFAACLFQSKKNIKIDCIHAAVKVSVQDVHMPTIYVMIEKKSDLHVHSVDKISQQRHSFDEKSCSERSGCN